MKKFFNIFLLGSILSLLIACSTQPTNQQTTTVTEVTTTKVDHVPPPAPTFLSPP